MKSVFIISILVFLTAAPAFSYSYCYKTSNKHIICREYTNGYGMYTQNNMPIRRYNYAPIGGGTTTVKYNAGFPVSVQKGIGPERSILNMNNEYQNSGASFVFK